MEEPIWPSIGEQLTPYKLALGILLHAYVTTKDEICKVYTKQRKYHK